MRFMILLKADKTTEAGVLPTEEQLAEMGKYNEELLKAGVLLAGEGLQPRSQDARVKFSGGAHTVSDGPFPATNELIAGFWLFETASREEAIEWVKRCPNPLDGEAEIEIRRVYEAEDFGVEFTPELRAAEERMRTQIAEAAGADRHGEHHGLGVSTIEFKVIAPDGGLLVLENTFHAKGGPPRHLHLEQDEWFYALEGEFVIEVGEERHTLRPGDSIVGPRRVPHVWAHVGEGRGRILVAFTPAGRMEAFFREVTKADAMPPQDPVLWREHGMELVGPPLPVE